uniref:MARVEL domain-containing protein n=1 Tax=Coptotermes formosanus TaxID=36987 RepID=R4UWN8_COPFO|nr:hypothetical protein [Coptotermes formosanus]
MGTVPHYADPKVKPAVGSHDCRVQRRPTAFKRIDVQIFLVNFFRMPYKARIAPSGVATVSTVEGRTGRGVRPVKGRRGTLYHPSSILEEKQNGTTTLDDVRVRRRFATSRYFLSPAGVLKLVVIILFLIAGTLFLTLVETCSDAHSWYAWLYPLACLVAFISTAFLYAMFMLGMAEDNPSLWVKLDVAITLTEAAAIVAISIITITENKCSSGLSDTALGPLGLAGAALMAMSSAATYIMWRYRSQEPPPASTTGTDAQQKSRVSVFI